MKEWVKGCDMGFYVGQEVMTESGAGVVTSTPQSGVYCIEVNIYLAGQRVYLKDGRYRSNDALPSVYPIELTPKFYQPEWQPKEGEWCWFWDSSYPQTIRRFSKILLISNHKYLDSYGDAWDKCAPFDGNMTPPWERGEEK